MKYAVVYSSNTGNTEMLARRIPEVMEGQECLGCRKPGAEADAAAAEAEVVFAGFWTDKGNCDPKMAEFLERLDGKTVFLFGTAGFGQSSEYFERILSGVKEHLKESNTVAGTWMCQGKMPMPVRKRYESMQESQPERAAQLIANFDQALSHPDSADLQEFGEVVRKFAKSVQK